MTGAGGVYGGPGFPRWGCDNGAPQRRQLVNSRHLFLAEPGKSKNKMAALTGKGLFPVTSQTLSGVLTWWVSFLNEKLHLKQA